jgi:hypothetical protein
MQLFRKFNHYTTAAPPPKSEHIWLRKYATSRKVVGSSPNELVEFLKLPNASSCIIFGITARPARKADKSHRSL